ncbi:MAG: tungsten ABC transporter substrate-binding protein, partial [Betaproteobacteria bacterium]
MNHRSTSILFLAAVLLVGAPASAAPDIRMSTTTSTENSGLLKVLLPPYEATCGCKV